MFSNFPWIAYAVLLIFYAIAGAILGGLVGIGLSALLRTDKHDLGLNSTLGAIGFVAGFLACVFVPFPRNTIDSKLPSGGYMSSTMNSYQHPFVVAFAVSAIFPAMHEINRWRRGKTRLMRK
jgi:hypothetical protein